MASTWPLQKKERNFPLNLAFHTTANEILDGRISSDLKKLLYLFGAEDAFSYQCFLLGHETDAN